MTEKKKMSVAEILAAARKADSGKGDEARAPAGATPAEGQADEAARRTAAASEAAAGQPAPAEAAASQGAAAAPKPSAKPAAGGRPSVAEILAAARAKKGGVEAAVEKPKPAEKPAAAKVDAAKKDAIKREPAAAALKGDGAKDTQSILAAARKSVKPGPMSKAEAARLASPAASPAKPAPPVVAPMPAKPAYAQKKAAQREAQIDRRSLFNVMVGSFLGLGFTSLSFTAALWTLGTARFMFPNVLIEPPSRFKVGFPADFSPGQVETKFVAQFGIWVVNTEYAGKRQIFALRTVCTHLGCTPNWLEAEQKFKCPCHGSGFYKDGINFEGPAPRPLERYAIRLADDGQVEIDKSKIFQEELGQWANAESFIPT